jgi:hypothetical protein
MKTKLLFFTCLINAMTGIYAYDFSVLNEDGVPIYYNFSKEGTSVVVTLEYEETHGETVLYYPTASYSGNIVIPESVMYDNQLYYVTAIGDGAFYGCALTGITMPCSVTIIGNSAFAGCYRLQDVAIPDNVITLGNEAFASCYGLTNISIPGSVTIIGENAFAGCFGTTTITIGENVAIIGSGAFYATNITSIIIPDNVITIGVSAFTACSRLREFIVSAQSKNYDTIDGVLFNKDKSILIAYPNAKSSVYTIPESVSIINSCAFRLCNNLTDITIPDGVTIIKISAFYGTKLSNVIIPNRVTTIEDFAFGACYELRKVTIPNSNITFGDRIFYWDDALKKYII